MISIRVVVHHRREVVGRHAVRLDQNGVGKGIGVKLHFAADEVLHDNRSIAWNLLSYHERPALGNRGSHLGLGRISPISAEIPRGLFVDLLELSHLG